MGLFGRKQDSSEDDIDDEEFEIGDDLENRKLKRQLRDLKSENKKQRQEPPKPWGRKERLIVLIVMVITILISGSLYLTSNPNFKLEIVNFKFPNIDFSSFNILKEGTIIIEKK